MASLKEIVEKEQQRTELEQMRMAYVYREGGFYRAYEWSAWLFVSHVSEFKVTCRMVKNIEQPVAFIGFPITSAGKFMPNGYEMTPNPDGSLNVLFPNNNLPENASVEGLSNEFFNWKLSLPITESSSKSKESKLEKQQTAGSLHSEPMGLTSIMQRIMAYPIESKSPLESMAFLAEVKQQLSLLI